MDIKSLFLLLIACLQLVGCDNPNVAKSPYPVIDSQALADINDSTFWLDNNRIIFTGREGKIPRTRREAIGRPAGIYIWDIAANTVIKHASLAPRFSKANLCYAEGRIFYYVEYRGPGRNEIFRFGPLGQEKEYVVQSKRGTLGLADRLNCQLGIIPVKIASKDQHRIKALFPRHGYLDYGPYGLQESNQSPQLYYVRKEDHQKIPMPWQGNVMMSDFQFYPFKNAYLIELEHWDEKRQVGIDPNYHEFPQPLRWLYPDGTTEEVSLPWVPWQKGGSLMFYATRKGYFVVSHGVPKHHGGYLYRDGRYHKVISGYIHGTSISPDGSKAAFSYSKDSWTSGAKGRKTIKTLNIIDFCADNKENRNDS